ncbi:TonB-dependent siderophore receptor [Parvibaculum sp.]|uniref:TonB-dependent siderophore receptor n=1 Tax=Parvibaculum sp. TaxID=2024848 RepID=UPI00272F1334|nr:TonB-dependent siderophore receptor [Parvibaculum sp.]MDP1625852.1 TonB-dependent siderophore receptor [Parvibaculum sp.]MDP2149215.1 TonB-dependent siderophore receptor [Parvibaculum sp.]MDP3330156.1 TonB-dependent siderophore receptor [Parvibaculum sp.]
MMWSYGRGPLAAVLIGTAALTAAPLRAQEQAESEAVDLAPLVVESEGERADGPVEGHFAKRSATATKTDTPIMETPQSISVISSGDMSARGARSLAQAMRYATGVTTESRGAVVSRYDMLTMRGFQINRNYLDGMQLQYNGWYAIPQIAPEMVERLEILKGPASVLYGSSPPGGLINLVSKRPEDEASGEVSASVGTNNLYEGVIDATGPLDDEGKYLYRFTGLARTSDGQAKTTEVERELIAPSFTWRPSSRTSLTFQAHYQQDPKSGAYGAVPASGSVFENPNGQLEPDFYDGDENWEEFNRKQWTLGYLFEHELDEVFTFRQNIRYLETKMNYKSVYSTGLQADNRTLNRASIYSDEDSTSYAIDNQLQARFGTGAVKHTVLAGLDRWDLNSDAEIGYGSAPTLDIFNPDNSQTIPAIAPYYDYKLDHSQTGVYLQEQAKIGGLTVLLGARQDWYKRRNFERLGGNHTGFDQDNLSLRAGALYTFENGIAPYISYAESFEPQSGSDFSGNPFEPTTGEQIEAGVKFQSADERVMVTAAVFEITKQNVTTADTAHPGFSIQTGEVRSRGFEIEGHVQPAAGLTLSAFYTKLDVEYTKDNGGLAGKTPTWVADETASLWAEYALPASMVDGLTVGGGVRYVGETYVDPANTGTTDPYTLFDAMLEYDLAAISPELSGNSVRLNGTNLADKRHVAGCYAQYWCWFGEERTVTLTLTHRW